MIYKIQIKDGKYSYTPKLEDGEYSFSIKKWTDERTVKQNSFYWLYLNLVEKETGEDANTMHEYFKRIFLEPKILRFQGNDFKVPASTVKLNKIEFSNYLKKIEEITGIEIPDTKHLEQLEEYLK